MKVEKINVRKSLHIPVHKSYQNNNTLKQNLVQKSSQIRTYAR